MRKTEKKVEFVKKKAIMLLLAAAVIGSLCACGARSETAPPAETAATVEPATETTVEAAPDETAETEPTVVEGDLFLKASSVSFSLVGEQEDIYLGVIPRELVSWESDDPSVVSVENGVLTATGVGTTTVRASYADRSVSCTVGCLAETEEALLQLDTDILCAPKRLPPEVDLEEPCTYFDNSAIVGDSITFIMFQWESKSNYLGDMLFLARGGTSLNGIVHRFSNIYYKGTEANLEDAIQQSGVERVYFLLGSNDIGDPSQRLLYFENWDIMLERIREKSPDVEIIMISNLPQYDDLDRPERTQPHIRTYNELMVEYNAQLRQYAEEHGCGYLDLSYYIQDHFGRMAKIYHQDNYHLNEAGCLSWMKVLRYYAKYELEGGTLS